MQNSGGWPVTRARDAGRPPSPTAACQSRTHARVGQRSSSQARWATGRTCFLGEPGEAGVLGGCALGVDRNEGSAGRQELADEVGHLVVQMSVCRLYAHATRHASSNTVSATERHMRTRTHARTHSRMRTQVSRCGAKPVVLLGELKAMVRDAVHRVGVVVGVGQIATWDLSRVHKPVERRLLARTFIVPPSIVCVCERDEVH
jgi:hypothetical protein